MTNPAIVPDTRTPSLRVFVSAGAPIPRTLVGKARPTLGTAVISAWGMSENGAVTTTRLEDDEARATPTDGCPLPGMELRIVDAEGKVLPAGAEGILQVRGCSNFAGYLKRPELDPSDPDGWFDTGDLARMDTQGYIRIAGRSKDIIIRGGENIPVVEVEGLLYRHPAVAEVAVVGFPDARLGERACTYGGIPAHSVVVMNLKSTTSIEVEMPVTAAPRGSAVFRQFQLPTRAAQSLAWSTNRANMFAHVRRNSPTAT